MTVRKILMRKSFSYQTLFHCEFNAGIIYDDIEAVQRRERWSYFQRWSNFKNGILSNRFQQAKIELPLQYRHAFHDRSRRYRRTRINTNFCARTLETVRWAIASVIEDGQIERVLPEFHPESKDLWWSSAFYDLYAEEWLGFVLMICCNRNIVFALWILDAYWSDILKK